MEYVVWYGLFGAFLSFVADTSMLFIANAQMWHVAQDTARRISVASVTATEAEFQAAYRISPAFRDGVQVVATTGDTISVEISVPVASATVFGALPGLNSGTLTARVVIRDEVAALTRINGNDAQFASGGTFGGG